MDVGTGWNTLCAVGTLLASAHVYVAYVHQFRRTMARDLWLDGLSLLWGLFILWALLFGLLSLVMAILD